jgi:SpoIID/LytB domain protein
MRKSILLLFALLALAVNLMAQDLPPVTPDDDEELQWLARKAEDGDSHASGMRPELGPVTLGNPAEAVRVIRVGLSPTTFNSSGAVVTEMAGGTNPAHTFADISHTAGTVHVIDKATGKQIIDIDPGTIVHVFHVPNAGYDVSAAGVPLGIFAGPIFFRPDDATNQFRVESIRRTFGTTQVPRYRGAIEITRGATRPDPGFVYVVNVIEVEDYVPGVVVNEGISSFHIEALKAQAVAARGYAIANVGRQMATRNFDIFDSTSSQVYRGVISEHVKAVQAASETLGLVASYNGRIIEALYSSSMGGRTENNEWIFNSPSSSLPGTNALAYLRGIYDGDAPIVPDPLSEPFWETRSQPNVYDDCSRVSPPANSFSRWSFRLDGPSIRGRLSGNSTLISGNTTGTVTNVEVLSRMPSGRIAVARVTLTTGVVELRGWDNLRFVLGRTPPTGTTPPAPRACGTSNIAASMVLNNPSIIQVNRDALGKFVDVTIWGGGWGHNLGMSQYGSHGRAKAGQNFIQILKGYYSGVDIGTYPIDIGRAPGTGTPTLRHTFYAGTPQGTLIVRATNGLKKLVVHINDTADFSIDEDALAAGPVMIDVSPYLVQGLNTLQYNPVGRNGDASVIVALE